MRCAMSAVAVAKADVTEIHIAEGLYDRVAGGWQGVQAARSIAVYGYGTCILTDHQSGLSWTLDGTLTPTGLPVRRWQRVLDASSSTPGRPAELVKRTSAKSWKRIRAPGGWTGTNLLYVQTATAGRRTPTSGR